MKKFRLEQTITFRVKKDTNNIIQKYSNIFEMSKSNWVRNVVLKELDRLTKDETSNK